MTTSGNQSRTSTPPLCATHGTTAHMIAPAADISKRRPSGRDRVHAATIDAAKYPTAIHSEERTALRLVMLIYVALTEVRPVHGRREFRQFIDYPYRLHA